MFKAIIESVAADCVSAGIIAVAAVLFGDKLLFAIKKRQSGRFLSPYDSAPQLDIEMFDNPVGNPVLYGFLRNRGHIGVKAVRWYACEYEPFSYLKITSIRASHVLGSRESEVVGSLGFGLSPDLFIQVGYVSRTVFIEFTDERGIDYRQPILLGDSSFSTGELERIPRRLGARIIVAEGEHRYHKAEKRYSLSLPCG